MFTPNQCQDNAQAVSRGQNTNASRPVSRVLVLNHSRAIGWAMSAYHSGAMGDHPAGTLVASP
jgi:hypothetical protein